MATKARSKITSFVSQNPAVLLLNITALLTFAKLLDDVVEKELVYDIDTWINHMTAAIRTPFTNAIILKINELMTPIFILLTLTTLAYLINRKKLRETTILTLSLSCGYASEYAIKPLIHRVRPENALLPNADYSFPSGHATLSIIIFAFIVYAFKDEIKSELKRYAFILANIAGITAVGFERVYLSVHWTSDVAAGYALGIFWLTTMVLALNYTTAKKKRHRFLTEAT
ncbi:Undecaprenyl-diphosphatase [uncultured archaeon]|nr:Undecaprenyl-diphosphatase [uncultured archaeon]